VLDLFVKTDHFVLILLFLLLLFLEFFRIEFFEKLFVELLGFLKLAVDLGASCLSLSLIAGHAISELI
jgi:hypothetical protein